MDFQFENITRPNKKLYTQAIRKTQKNWIILLLIAVSYMIYMAYSFVEAYAEYIIAVDCIVWFAVFFGFAIWALAMPSISAKRTIRLLCSKNLGQPVVIVRQFGDRIVSSAAGSVNTLDYCNIKKIYSLKSCYVILFVNGMGALILSREGFTKGTFAEFKQFLRAKRPDLNIPE